jgi:outer membrane protein assembly factor BamE
MVCQASMKKQIQIFQRTPLESGPRVSLLLALLASGLMSACTLPTLSLTQATQSVLYIPEVVQGNFVSREQKEALKPGLSRQQVKDVLGTPLVASVFHDERWDYVFTIRRQGVAPQSFSLSVWFKGDVLERTSGDELPSETEFVTQLVAKKEGIKVPNLEAKEEDLRKYPAPVRKADTGPAPVLPLPSSYPPLEPAAP